VSIDFEAINLEQRNAWRYSSFVFCHFSMQ